MIRFLKRMIRRPGPMPRLAYCKAVGRAAYEVGLSHDEASKALRAGQILYAPPRPEAKDPRDRHELFTVGDRAWRRPPDGWWIQFRGPAA